MSKLFKPEKFKHYEERVPRNLRKAWESRLTESFKLEAKGYFIVPFACKKKNVIIKDRTDRVKRMNDETHTLPREYLTGKYRKYNTHDNAADEGFYGGFFYEDVSIEDYLKSDSLRYKARVKWLWRNMAYTALYEDFGVEKEDKPLKVFTEGVEDSGEFWVNIEIYENYFLYESQVPDGKGGYKSYKFGHKSHRSAPIIEETGKINVMYANRVIVLKSRKYK